MGFFVDILKRSLGLFVLGFAAALFAFPLTASAGLLSSVSDLINTSVPSGTSTTHLLTFTTATTIPVSGRIVLTPEATSGSSFDIPASFVFSDVSVAVSIGGGPFIPRSIAATPSALNDGVTIVSGASGSITIILASGFNIPLGATVRVGLGNAHFITSPALSTSYRVRIQTRNAVNTVLDRGTAMIAIVAPVGVDAGAGNVIPPVRSNGLPSGLIPGSTVSVMVSLNTDATAFCKFSATPGIDFWAMATSTIMTTANFGTLHYVNQTVYENDIFDYYIRCMNESNIINTTDYNIHFEVGVIPNASTTYPVAPPTPPSPPAPSGPSGGGGGGGLFLQQGAVTLQGASIPGGTLIITKDGAIVKEEALSILGTFDQQFTGLERGTYTWGVSVRDATGKKSSVYSSTIYILGGTNNIIAPVYLSPTITTATATIPIGGDIRVTGFAIPLVPVEVIMNKQGDAQNGKIVTASSTANGNGSWTVTLSTEGLSKGTYEVKAHSLVSSKDRSNFSPVLYVGVGENPNPNFKNRADLNRDGKVNLVDFSILLFNWKTSDAVADINQDGNVNLTDFSIMLANWTG